MSSESRRCVGIWAEGQNAHIRRLDMPVAKYTLLSALNPLLVKDLARLEIECSQDFWQFQIMV